MVAPSGIGRLVWCIGAHPVGGVETRHSVLRMPCRPASVLVARQFRHQLEAESRRDTRSLPMPCWPASVLVARQLRHQLEAVPPRVEEVEPPLARDLGVVSPRGLDSRRLERDGERLSAATEPTARAGWAFLAGRNGSSTPT